MHSRSVEDWNGFSVKYFCYRWQSVSWDSEQANVKQWEMKDDKCIVLNAEKRNALPAIKQGHPEK